MAGAAIEANGALLIHQDIVEDAVTAHNVVLSPGTTAVSTVKANCVLLTRQTLAEGVVVAHNFVLSHQTKEVSAVNVVENFVI